MNACRKYFYVSILGLSVSLGFPILNVDIGYAAEAGLDNASQPISNKKPKDAETAPNMQNVPNDFVLPMDGTDPKLLDALKQADKDVPADQIP